MKNLKERTHIYRRRKRYHALHEECANEGNR